MPARFQEKFSVVQAKGGESAKLECNATGDQPLTVNWFKEDNKLSKRGGDNFEIYETMTSNGINSVLVIRTVSRAEGLTYKCIGENEYGNDERLIKLLVVEVPSRPMNVRVKDTWSRSASVVWSSPFAGNSPITSYIIQYWRKNSNEANGQNHRRQEFTVSGTQTSALITNLMPSLTYEASVIAENQVGKSEPSENVVISTGEDEPTAAPSDVTVEARGPSTIRVTWKVPPSETWNGKLLGFYIGFRPRGPINTIDANQMSGSTSGAFSYRTIDYMKGQQIFETFLTNLMRGYEYEVVVKAFNSVGSGPESHLMAVRTFDGDLPAPPTLFAHQTTHSSISLRWTYPSKAQSVTNPIKRYVLYYQRQGDDSWLEIGIPVEEKLRSPLNHNNNGQSDANYQQGYSVSETGTTSYLLTGLDSGFAYKIYVIAVNNFGMGDPSNIVATKTEQINGINDSLRSGLNPSDFNLFEMNKQIQFFMVVPVICTIILVAVIISTVFYCSRRMQQNPTTQHVVAGNGNGLQPTGTWGPDGSIHQVGGHRYVEFDKGGILKTNNGSLLTGTQGSDQNSSAGHPSNQHYQLPYGTMPMNSVIITDQKSWDRQSSNAPLKPLVTHIYDSPI